MTKEARIYNEEKSVSSKSGVVKAGSYIEKHTIPWLKILKWPMQLAWVCVYSLSHGQLFATPWSIAPQILCGILQARILEWVAILFSRGSSLSRN